MRLANRVPRIVFVITMSLSLAACGGGGDDDDDDNVVDECYPDPELCVDPAGDDAKYVADSIIMPTSVVEADQLGLNLDGDPQGRPDNALGQILSTLASQGDLDLQLSVDEEVSSAGVILLMRLKATSLDSALDTGTWVYLGENPVPAACVDPDNIATCGQHLNGEASFDIAPSSPMNAVLHGDLIRGRLTAGPGRMTLELALTDGAPPITINLIGARMEANVNATTGVLTDGKIGGAITEAELDTNVMPALVTVIQETVADDCMGTPPAACCVSGSTGETVMNLFDDNGDCMVSLDELRNNDLISSLLSPDVDLLDENGNFNPRVDEVNDALSLGIGFSAVGASYALP